MTKFCTNCGKEIAEGVAFCTECGASVNTRAPAPAPKPAEQTIPTPRPIVQAAQEPPAPSVQPSRQPEPTWSVSAQPVYQQPVPPPIMAQGDMKPAPGSKYGVVGTGTFFGLMLLFMLPVVGWIVCLIMAFASKNENKKHFARAMLIWVLISVVLCVVTYFLFSWIGKMLMEYINEATDGAFGNWKVMFDQFSQFENGGTSGLPFN